MELKFLGRGSAFNVREGNTSAYYKKGDMLLLFDCGESIFQKILEKELLDNIKEINVLITHLHSDHVGSLSSLIMYCYYNKGIKPDVYFQDRNVLSLFLESTGALENAMWTFLNLRKLNKKYGIWIDCCEVTHVNEFNSYSYFIEEGDNTIYYSGDTNSVKTKYNFLDDIKNITKVYHDCCLADYEGNVHTSLKKLCELIPKIYRSKIWCMHIDCDELIIKAKEQGFNVVKVDK